MNNKNTQDIIYDINRFIHLLNNESILDSIVIVEGKKDKEALKYLGFKGNITTYHSFKGTTHLIDHFLGKYKRLILLLDSDKKGKAITTKILSQLNGRYVDLNYKKRFLNITKGKVKKIEEIKTLYINMLKN